MRAVITGGAGFIGSHLADRLLADGHRVTVLDDLSTGSYHNIDHLCGRSDFEFVLGSILNADLVDDVIARSDVVFHLAAAVGVNLIVEQPLESLMTNVRGSEVVMEKTHKHGSRVLVTSTSEIYGKNTSDRLSESRAPDTTTSTEAGRGIREPVTASWLGAIDMGIWTVLLDAGYTDLDLPNPLVKPPPATVHHPIPTVSSRPTPQR